MTLNDYQKAAKAFYSYALDDISGPTLGLCAESGEVADVVEHSLRRQGKLTEQDRSKILEELGDTLWQLAAVATHLGYDLNFIAEFNISKLTARRNEAYKK